jgi:2-keto-4-pentenoate hydratase/2-oxohepta-3-ene-1,7-dioic acid hydratase in catechol pathway
MKIARVQHGNSISYATVEQDTISLIEGDIFGQHEQTDTQVPLGNVTLLAPVEPRQIVAIGLNYRKHALETKKPLPDHPLVFLKGVNALTGPNTPIVLPAMAPDNVDYEAELAIVIGKECKNVSETQAADYILGYTCGIDVSARDCQLRLDRQWARGKSFDTFAPLGPWIVTDINGDNLDISLKLNGTVMQDSNTSDLIFSCTYLVSYLSQCMTLYPGSIIMTGTPSGVGAARKPQVFLREGDRVDVTIEHIGILSSRVQQEILA